MSKPDNVYFKIGDSFVPLSVVLFARTTVDLDNCRNIGIWRIKLVRDCLRVNPCFPDSLLLAKQIVEYVMGNYSYVCNIITGHYRAEQDS